MSDINVMNKISSIQALDKFSISSISFIPSNCEIECLIKISDKAKIAIQNKIKSDLLTNIKCNTMEECKMIPDSYDPNDTILIKKLLPMATKEQSVVELQPGYLYVINDTQIPFEKTSTGPIGVLSDCQSTMYGKNRINLFDKNIHQTKKLLSNYIKTRNEKINHIYDLFVKKLNTYTGNNQDMENVIAMFNLISEKLKIDNNLKKYGISVISFCQTWIKEGNTTNSLLMGPAQFNIMSPCFQTRFYVHNENNLIKCGISKDMYISYLKVIKNFTNNMQENYGIGGTGCSFINLDLLNNKLTKKEQKKNINSPKRHRRIL